ncbi:hypothetical protein Q4489_14535 [Thalassotalea sp. 1_MG-2023]|uniref:hypothetical protein n=1 Tax=Thalassotalea sp. 1_MG-2023 TaxID=3062680 RepID=UPI0026E31E8A|nr:hypothetical protein [Thalassotalea sp. 1_MG-2023]MDO6428235.1 hypothetical protein [Thalassotalea sp. 1_MG-2023]
MNSFIRWFFFVALIIAAIACYSYGSSTGLFVFIVLGGIFELACWFGIFSRKSRHSKA